MSEATALAAIQAVQTIVQSGAPPEIMAKAIEAVMLADERQAGARPRNERPKDAEQSAAGAKPHRRSDPNAYDRAKKSRAGRAERERRAANANGQTNMRLLRDVSAKDSHNDSHDSQRRKTSCESSCESSETTSLSAPNHTAIPRAHTLAPTPSEAGGVGGASADGVPVIMANHQTKKPAPPLRTVPSPEEQAEAARERATIQRMQNRWLEAHAKAAAAGLPEPPWPTDDDIDAEVARDKAELAGAAAAA